MLPSTTGLQGAEKRKSSSRASGVWGLPEGSSRPEEPDGSKLRV